MDIPEHDLPLFPLNTVLFPRMTLPLHIFEPRYQEMMTRCIRERIGFGVLLIKEGEEVGGTAETFTVGTVARIISVDELEDGRMNMMSMGMVRFRLLHSSNDHPYLSGDIETWEDEMGELKDLPKLTKAAHKAYVQYVTELAQLLDEQDRPDQISAPMDPQVLSYTIAANLQVPDEEKQNLLEIETVQERLARELEMLESERTYLQRVKMLRQNFPRGESSTFSKN
jgi:Lon protease-like protein